MNAKERLVSYLKEKGIGQTAFEEKAGLNRGQISKKTGFTVSSLEKITSALPELNPEWLLNGNGEKFKRDANDISNYSVSLFSQNGYAPFYSDIKISAGRYDLAAIENKEVPESYIKIPGVNATAWFPVIGFSMEPKIHAGDIIGVRVVAKWDRVEPGKVYMIVTHDDRMIKRLRVDDDDEKILWCSSDNHRDFKISTTEIKAIYQVVFAGRLI